LESGGESDGGVYISISLGLSWLLRVSWLSCAHVFPKFAYWLL
jgi:hypothetical protein